MGSILQSKDIVKKLPAWVLASAKTHFSKAKTIDANSQAVMTGTASLKFTVGETLNVIKECMAQKAFITSLLQRAMVTG